jgi:hypothetical protein
MASAPTQIQKVDAKPAHVPLQPGQATLAIFEKDQPPAIVKFAADGKALRAVRQQMRLDPNKGETFALSAKTETGWTKVHSMTAAAYNRCNQIVGVTFYTPPTILDDDGKERPNPYFERSGNDAIKRVKIRKVGIGRNAIGNMMAVDYTLSYDLGTYLGQDLLSKWQGKREAALADWGVLGTDQRPAGKNGSWVPVPIPMPGMYLWLDTSRKEVTALIQEHVNRQKFAERNATTICERNILRRFIPASKLDKTLSVTVTGWITPDRDMHAVGAMAARAERGELTLDTGEPVEIARESEAIDSPEEIDGILAGEADEEMAAHAEPEDADEAAESHHSVQPSPPAPAADPEIAKLRAEIRELAAQAPDPDGVLGACGCEGMEEIARAGKLLLTQVRDAFQRAMPAPAKTAVKR